MKSPKILLLDIETSPIVSYHWGLFDQNISLSQVKGDWHLLSYAAKWLNEPKIFYKDQRNAKDLTNDKDMLKEIWKLLDECDILLTQNGVSFDHRKINARFVIAGMKPPSPFRHIDTYRLAKKHFAFTSHKLEYMTNTLNTKYKKLKHGKFAGFELWRECLAGNKAAWKVMEKYNKYDVLSLEELYLNIRAWDNSIDYNVYNEGHIIKVCSCRSTDLQKRGYTFTNTGKFQKYVCVNCGRWTRSKINLLSKEKKAALK